MANGVWTVPLINKKDVKSASRGGVLKSRKGRSAILKRLKVKKHLVGKLKPRAAILRQLKVTGRSVTLKHLAAKLSEAHEMSKEQTEAALGDLVNRVTKHLKRGDRIRIGGLGVLVVRRGRRKRPNAATEELIPINPMRKGIAPALVGVVEAEAAPNLLAEPVESAYAPSARALALLRGKEISEADLKESGGSFTLQDVESLLGISRQAIDKKVQDNALLAIPGPHGRRRYPVVQFTTDGTVPGLQKVLKSLPSTNGWFRLNFLVTPDAHLGDQRPVDVLKQGHIEPVVTAAKAVGVQGA
jgi:nucleoid DNA-binding protein